MRLSSLALLPLILAAAEVSFAQAPYVDPTLHALIQPQVRAAARRPAVPFAASAAIRPATAIQPARVAMFAQLRNEAGLADLRAIGARIGSRVGNIVTAEVPLDRLESVFASPNIVMLEAAREVAVAHDSSMRAIHADQVRSARDDGTWAGSAGSGVLIGVYDTGLDFSHDDFLDAAGRTRVLGLWDQTATDGAPPAGFDYGHYCDRAAIQQSVQSAMPACRQRDVNGHGTHVTGTAAGDGSAVGTGGVPYAFAGVAPLTELLVVKGGNGLFSEAMIVDGLVFFERTARALNRPVVVNLSMGSQAGPHDGSRLYEVAIDSLSRPGFIVVVSAGNEGFNHNDLNADGSEPFRDTRLFHASGMPGTTREFTIDVAPYTAAAGACNDFVQIGLWYDATARVDISLVPPAGTAITALAGQLREGDGPTGHVRIDNGSRGANPRNNAFEADIRADDCGSGAAPASGVWTLRVTAAAHASAMPYHLWLHAQALGEGAMARGGLNFDNHNVVSSPGNARSAITVGAFASRHCWQSAAKSDGPVCFTSREQRGDLARFSSGGPTRDGRMKPEITAPGLAIASAKSRDAAVAANRILPDGVHWINQGTSMAAPHVTGAIALMLEVNPLLTSAQVREILARTADQDRFTARVFDHAFGATARAWWGYGKLNVCAAIAALGGTARGDATPIVITPAVDTLPVHATTRLYSCSPGGGPLVFRSTNPEVASVDATGTVRALHTGRARVIVTSGLYADTADVIVTEPAVLHVSVRNAAPDSALPGPRGTVMPLLSLTLRADGFEAIRLDRLAFRMTGDDAAARLLLVVDANANGVVDAGERAIAAHAAALRGVPQQIQLTVDSTTIAQRDSLALIAALELSGSAPNTSAFTATLLPATIGTTGARSGSVDRIAVATTDLASSAGVTTVVRNAAAVSLSENPVRSGRVTFNFNAMPRVAGVYTLTGRLVADLKRRSAAAGSIAWDLTNDAGVRVATGVYLAVFDFGSGPIREKLFVMPTAIGAQ